ncbi:MAG: nicotinate-nucleotide adenylyltransferase [Bacteroidetes bacterium]|nr:MAG: nicotinate-nucleotide adenylyltransferase [Bacteroidota bacterium]
MKIGLFFGSFNPIHIGHLVIANYMVEFTDLKQVWLVVSPHNPLKEKKWLADALKRLTAVKKAVGKNSKIKVSDVEFLLPQPSYTINTLDVLNKKYPQHEFVLIIGSDNLNTFHKWKDYKKILSKHTIYVYPRILPINKGRSRRLLNHRNVKFINAPRIDISSTFIREQMKKGKDMGCFLV